MRLRNMFKKEKKGFDWNTASPETHPKFIFGDKVCFKNDTTRTPLKVLDVKEGITYHNGIGYRKTWYYTLLYPVNGERYYSDEYLLELVLSKGN